jgi:NodT family efflux transporter outer membrane factor (OMF) lipoprotein
MKALLLTLLLAGCAVGPDFEAPKAPVTERYLPEATAPSLPQGRSEALAAQQLVEARDIPADWWTLFHSPELNALVDEALAHSPDVQAAEAALRSAREAVLAQQGAFFPTLDASLSPTRQSVANTFSSPLNSNGYIYNLHTAQLTIGYAPDVFGLNRRQVESLTAQADAQRYASIAARLTLTTNLVQAVIQQASLRAQRTAAEDMIAAASRQLDLFRRGQGLGQFGAADVAAQETVLAQAQALLPPIERQLAQQIDLIAVLTGRLPGDAKPSTIALQLPAELPLSVPSRLVEQRPDIRAATEQLHATSALIGVAIANRLPNLTLTAGGGSAALRFADLFASGTGFWSLGANLTQPLFDGGALLHRERAARANYDQAAAQYRSTVLLAFGNVADTLVAIDADRRTLVTALAAERAARRSLDVVDTQRNAGAIGVVPVLTAEQAYRQAVMTRIQAEAARLTDSVALFQALGGGWWNDPR